MSLFRLVPVCAITRFCHPYSDETQKSLMMITIIVAQFVCLHLLCHLQTQAHIPNNPSSADFSWVFSCNYAEQRLWFPWRVSKINIKVSDRRAAYWFKRSQTCSHNVSTFDLWPVFMFFDNTAASGCDCGWTPPWLEDHLVILPTPSVHSFPIFLRPHWHEAVPACTDGADMRVFFFLHMRGRLCFRFTAQLL